MNRIERAIRTALLSLSLLALGSCGDGGPGDPSGLYIADLETSLKYTEADLASEGGHDRSTAEELAQRLLEGLRGRLDVRAEGEASLEWSLPDGSGVSVQGPWALGERSTADPDFAGHEFSISDASDRHATSKLLWANGSATMKLDVRIGDERVRLIFSKTPR